MVALAALTIIMVAPLWMTHAPAAPDYPAHLASFWLIAGGQNPFYSVHWTPSPNLASEMLVPLLARLTGLETAAKLFLSIGVCMWVMGAAAIQRALNGRVGVTALLGGLFAYNANFFWAFFNYYFSAGLALMLFAGWIASDKHAGVARTLLFALAVIGLYFCHVFAALDLLAMIAGFEILRGFTGGGFGLRAIRVTVLLAPVTLLFALSRRTSAGMQLAFNLSDTMRDRFESLMLYRFDAPNYWLPILIGFGLLLALCLKQARLVRPLWLVTAGLIAASLLAPEEAMGGWGVHLRLPALAALLVLAATEVRLPSRVTAVLTIAILIFAGWESFTLAADWTQYDSQTQEFRSAESRLPEGSRLLTVLDSQAIGWKSDPPYWHMAEWAVMDRKAMTALMFTTKGQHVVALKPDLAPFAAATADQGMPPDIGDLNDLAAGSAPNDDRDYLRYFPCHYSEALVIDLGGKISPVPAMLTLRHKGSFFALYDIAPGPLCKGR